jgi:RNA polymerase sigma factor (sigma-70 family)
MIGLDFGTSISKPVMDIALDRPERLSVDDVIRQHHKHLVTWLRNKLSTPEDAHDVAQEAYIRLLKYEGSSDIRSVRAILQQIAMNVVRDLGRARRSRFSDQHYCIEDVELESMEPALERVIEAEQNLNTVIKAIEKLPAKCRRVFLLSRVQGMSYPEIAAHCDISVKMVEKHISHALLICVQSLRE